MSFATVCLYSMYRMRKEMSQTRIFTDAWNQILAAGGNPNLGTENAAIFKFDDVKVRRTSDAIITVDLPFDDSTTNITDIETCNVACVAFSNANSNDYDVYWYWVNDYTEISRAPYVDGGGVTVERVNYRFTLELNPTATVFSDDDDMAIIPERLPFETDGVRQNWTTSIMTPGTPNTALPKIPKCPISKTRTTSSDPYTEQGTVWVEVTFSETSPDKLKRYGFFAAVNPSDELPTVYTNVFADTYSGDQQIHVYPTVAQIIANPETYLGLSSVTIHDINISEYCPFSAIGDISFGENVTFTQTKNSGIGTGNHYWNDVYSMLSANPLVPLLDPVKNDGSYAEYGWLSNSGLWTLDSYTGNPVASMVYSSRGNNDSHGYGLTMSGNIRVQPIKGLTWKSQFNYRMSASTYRQYGLSYKIS